MKIFLAVDENDKMYSQKLFDTPQDLCKVSQGVRNNFFTKIFMENFEKSANFLLSCPVPKNTSLKLTNCVMTDKYILPTLVEKKFKVICNFFGMVNGKKEWLPLYSTAIYGRFKRNING